MKNRSNAIRAVLSVSAFSVSVLAMATYDTCGLQLASMAYAATQSKLGDLSKFRTIAVDTHALTEQGQLSKAKERIRDLESEWDDAESGLKPRAAADWHKVDKAIDKALSALRASNPNQADCRRTLDDVLKTIDELRGKSGN